MKEALTALRIEALYSKDEILEIYLNTVPFLYNAFGIEMAARTYFDKSASQLNVLESATLIGMLKGTSYYNPVQNPQRARARRNVVLAQMVKHNTLEAARATALAKQPLKLDFERQDTLLGPAPHVAQWVRKWLIDWADSRSLNIYSDGLVVRTTLHAKTQKAANQAMGRQLGVLQPQADRQRKRGQEKVPLQAGFMALDPRNGHVVAWVGSRDFATEQFDHVGQARRQAGSTFKPFVYGAAFEMGRSPSDELMDQALAISIPGGGVWSPSDGTPQRLAHDAARRPGVLQKHHHRAADDAGRPTARGPAGPCDGRAGEHARRGAGIGAGHQLCHAARDGDRLRRHCQRRPLNGAGAGAAGGRLPGHVLQRFAEPVPEQAMSQPQALQLVNVMRGVVDEGTGTAIRSRYGIQADVAGKTGTTQDNTDGWFILMHPQLVAGAWVGFNDSSITMGDGWGPGARSALPMVGEVFQQSLRNRWIDPQAAFDIARSRPQPAQPPLPEPLRDLSDFIGRLFKAQ